MSAGIPGAGRPTCLPSTMPNCRRWGIRAFCLILTTRWSTTARMRPLRWEALFRELDAMGMKTLLLSDNSAERIQRFNKHIGAPYIAEAGKPDPAAYRRGAKMLGLPVEQVVCIGDQVFRDIRGANRCGMASILVDFIRLPQETHYGKKRVLEKYIMACWRRNPRWRDRLGNIQK